MQTATKVLVKGAEKVDFYKTAQGVCACLFVDGVVSLVVFLRVDSARSSFDSVVRTLLTACNTS